MSDYSISLSWGAQRDLQRLEVGTGCEVAGGMFGYIDRHTVQVTMIMAGRTGPSEPGSVPIELDYWLEYEQSGYGDRDERVLVGDAHSHEGQAGRAIASATDLDAWADISRVPHQHLWAGLILTASGERWTGGYPDGLDWDEPHLTGWVADRGEVWAAPVHLEPQWLADLGATVKFQPRRSTYAEDA